MMTFGERPFADVITLRVFSAIILDLRRTLNPSKKRRHRQTHWEAGYEKMEAEMGQWHL